MGGIFNTVDLEGNKDIILPTVLRVTQEEIDYWTNMTCFYDKYWEFNPKLSTVPISFMHITSVTEIISAQGAEKRVIVYEAPETVQGASGFSAQVSSHPAYKNNLEVIMDNVVVQPKKYQMEVIIPDSLIGPFHEQGLARLTALVDYMGLTDMGPSFVEKIGTALRGAQLFLDTVETAESLLNTLLGSVGSIEGSVGTSQMATINKNSIEAMAGKGHVLLFKKWTGYDYSYGLITEINISKKPTENGVYRGSITFQEAPILNITKKNVSSVNSVIGAINSSVTNTARILNLSLSYPFMKITGVMDEAGAPGSKTADGGSTFDLF